jgi:L-cysteate sulfo-lyase
MISVSLEKFPRIPLVHLPTPMRKLENLSKELGGPEIWIKRDDLTGVAFGGNKSRKLEYILPDILAKKADIVVTWAALQSNWAMHTAAAVARFGIKPVLILFKRYDLPVEPDGNMLLDHILGAEIRIREPLAPGSAHTEDYLAVAEEVAAELRSHGRKPYVVPIGGSRVMGDMTLPLGALAYVQAFGETLEQARGFGFEPDAIVHSSGSGSTQAGLVVGAKILGSKARVVGISVSEEKGPFTRDVAEIVEATESALGTGTIVSPEDIIVFDEFIRDGYGIINRDVAGVIRLVFTREGIVLDPVYTSKAFVGMMDLIRRRYFMPADKLVFIHTGGTPALFPNRTKIAEYL